MKYNSKTTAIPEIIPVVLICTAGIISAARIHPQLALLFHRDYFRRSNASLSCSFAPQGLFCLGQMHLYLPLLSHRDYFRRSNASLSCSFLPQGLFPPPGFISILLFCSTGIISTGRMHLYLALFFHRDYFHRPDASLSSSFVPQGLFRPAECISIFLFCFTGIISAAQMHLYLALLLHRDYFHRPDASLSCFSVPQRLFPPSGCISILLFCSTGIISSGRMHPCLPLLSHRDYFHRPNASLSSPFAPQGLFPPAGCIYIFLFCSTRIISASRMHLYLALLFHRDYFRRSDSSLPFSFAPQGLFLPVGFIPSLLFSSTGIISANRMHPQLALFFHRDYFGQPNASLIRAPVKYQRPNFYYTGNTRMASADTLCKKLPQDRQKQSVLSLSVSFFCRYGDILFW